MKYLILIISIGFLGCSSTKKIDTTKTPNQKTPKELAIRDIIQCLNYTQIRTKENIMGLINLQSQKRYDSIFQNFFEFNGKYANVIRDNTAGYIDQNGKIKLFPQYDFAFWFDDDFGYAVKNNKAAIINRKGRLITDFIYNNIGSYNEGLALVKKGDIYSFVNKQAKEVFKPNMNLSSQYMINSMTEYRDSVIIENKKESKIGLIHITGKLIIQAKYDYISGYFSDGLMHVQNKFHGFVDQNGTETIPLKYEEIGDDFDEFLVHAKFKSNWGFINNQNETIIPFIYQDAQPFSDGLALVSLEGKKFFIDKLNNIKIPFSEGIRFIHSFKDGLAVFQMRKKYGFIDIEGKIKIEAIYDEVSSFKNGYAIVTIDGKKGVINPEGKIVLPIVYKELSLPTQNFIYYIPMN